MSVLMKWYLNIIHMQSFTCFNVKNDKLNGICYLNSSCV